MTKFIFWVALAVELIGIVALAALFVFMGIAGYIEAFGIFGGIVAAALLIFLVLDFAGTWIIGIILYYFNASDGGIAFFVTIFSIAALCMGAFVVGFLSDVSQKEERAREMKKAERARERRQPVTIEHEQ